MARAHYKSGILIGMTFLILIDHIVILIITREGNEMYLVCLYYS